jgi:hypothetical protein
MTTKRKKTTRASSRGKRRLAGAAEAWRGDSTAAGTAGHPAGKPRFIGYAGVSTVDRNLALQRDALTEAGCGKIFISSSRCRARLPTARLSTTRSNSRAAAIL